MPICIPAELPAQNILRKENVFVMDAERATSQDIRPLQVGILNLMPNKIETEVQLCRLLSNTPLHINIDLIRAETCSSKHTPQAHLDAFYLDFDSVVNKHYDGLIITGAPVASIPYEEVTYWHKVKDIMDWSRNHVQSTLHLCWAAHAAMYYHYGVNRHLNSDKLFGVFEHQVNYANDELMRGFDQYFMAPHSRYGNIAVERYEAVPELRVLASSPDVGAYVVASEDKRVVFLTGHPEYEADTLGNEYHRDVGRNLNPSVPHNYFVGDDPKGQTMVKWRAHGNLLFTNWLNYYVYQRTPYDLSRLSNDKFEQQDYSI